MLSWVRPFDGNSPVLYYIVELSENSEYGGKAGAVDMIGVLSVLFMSLPLLLAQTQSVNADALRSLVLWR